MLSLLGSPFFLFRHLFLQQLPSFIYNNTVSKLIYNRLPLPLEADKLYLAGSSNNIQEVSHTAAKHNSNKAENICWYHHRFSKSAKKCLPGCKYYHTFNKNQGNEQQGSMLATSSSIDPEIEQLIITDENTNRRFLLDTGAQFVVVPASWSDKHCSHHTPCLQAANGTSISTFGSYNSTLKFCGNNYKARLIKAMKVPILKTTIYRGHEQ